MKKINKLLVANRGEIAVRIMRTARQMGYRTVAVYSEVDKGALHVECANESICIGMAPASESYLCIDKIIQAAKSVNADAIHPGYGFLSENADFAEACAKANILFVGPSPSTIRLMGSKRQSKLAMLEHGVSCIPGYQGAEQDDKTILVQAKKIGMPLMLKASAGGGGRGMRLVFDQKNLQSELNLARSEALSAFGDDEIILERALIEPRHIEIQVFADSHGNVVYLGERDCSIQRRHQKVVEESPSPFVDDVLRKKMGLAAVNVARACNYVGAGTVEFLVDENKDFYFLEMNTRLQVEHPVTEMVTGQDLVQWQLQVTEGKSLPLTQEQIQLQGHAIEVRLYAEDPRQDFLPQTGRAVKWEMVEIENVRLDSGIKEGQEVSAYYDPMLAKIIAYADDRATAIAKLSNTLANTVLLGVNNNKQFLQSVLEHPSFIQGQATTGFLQSEFPNNEYQVVAPNNKTLAIAALLLYRNSQLNPVYYRDVWSVAVPLQNNLILTFEGKDYTATISHNQEQYSVEIAGELFELQCEHHQHDTNKLQVVCGAKQSVVNYVLNANTLLLDDGSGHFEIHDNTYRPASVNQRDGETEVLAPMDGRIVEIAVEAGQPVQTGEVVAVLEAMKMAHQLKAASDGQIEEVTVKVGQQVKTRQLVAKITEIKK